MNKPNNNEWKKSYLLGKQTIFVGTKVKRKNVLPKQVGEVIQYDPRDIYCLIKWTEEWSNWSPIYMLEVVE